MHDVENRLKQMKAEQMKLLLLFLVGGFGMLCVFYTSENLWNFLGKSCCLFCFVYLIWKGINEDFLLNPYLLFCIIPLSLVLYYPPVSPKYLGTLSGETWIVILWNIGLFLIGHRLVKPYTSNKLQVGSVIYRLYDDIEMVQSAKAHFWISLTLGTMPTIYGLITGVRKLLEGDLYSMREYVNGFPGASIIFFLQYFAIACAFRMKKKRYILGGIAVQGLCTLLVFDKTRILFLALTVGVCWLKYYRGQIKLSRVIVFAVLILAVMLWGFSFYESIRSTESVSMTDRLINRGDLFWNAPKALAMPYMYLVQGWNNLQYVMETQSTHTFGLWLLNPILHYLPIEFGVEKQLEAQTFFNTFTYVGVQFKDFGIIGSGLVSALLGGWIKKIYTMFLASDSPISACVYALNATAVFQMFFSNHFLAQIYPFMICLILLAYEFIFMKIRVKRLEND